METILRNVSDLDDDARSALERVVGHGLGAKQQLIIQVTEPGSPPANGSATQAGVLPSWCNVYEGLSEEEIDALDSSIVRSPGGRTFS